MGDINVGVIAIFCVAWAIVGAMVGSSKPSIGAGGGFILGLLLGPLGVIIAAVASSAKTPEVSTLDKIQRRPDDPTPGWHDDPLGRFDGRWWNGERWTAQVGRVEPDGTRKQYEDPV